MKNFENRVVWLTVDGASRLFSNPACAGLPVVPTDPTIVGDTIVYGDTYTVHSHTYVGGCISQDAFSDESIPVGQVQAAIEAYEAHCIDLDERFGASERRTIDLEAVTKTPQTERIPTLEEKWEARQKADEPVIASGCPQGWDHV